MENITKASELVNMLENNKIVESSEDELVVSDLNDVPSRELVCEPTLYDDETTLHIATVITLDEFYKHFQG